MKKEFVLLQTTAVETQKLIRTWVSTGYEVEIVAQSTIWANHEIVIITSIWRSK